MSVKHHPLTVGQNKDNRLGKSPTECPAVVCGRGGQTFTSGEGNCRRQQRDMLLIESVVLL